MSTTTAEQDRRIIGLVLGQYLGGGVAREVYAYRPNPSMYVIKVATDQSLALHDYQNIAEWMLWENAPDALAEWLAPCITISPCGGALLQARCEPCPRHLIPKRLPKVLGDLHQANFGLYQSRPVVMDYGRNYAHRMSANAKVMRKVDLSDGYTGV